MKNLLPLFAAICCTTTAVISNSAFAETYVGAGIGQANETYPNFSGISSASVPLNGLPVELNGDGHRTAWNIFAGYQFTPHCAIEAGYVDLGHYAVHHSVGTFDFDRSNSASSASVSAVGKLPISERVFILGKLGITNNHFEHTQACSGGICIQGGSSNRVQPLFGIGVGYAIEKMTVRLEYNSFGKISEDNVGAAAHLDSVKADAWLLGLSYGF